MPPKTKREGVSTPTIPAEAPPTAHAAMQRVASKAKEQRDATRRTELMNEASGIVAACVASAPSGIDQTRELFEALWKNQIHGFTDTERHRLLRELLEGLFSSAELGSLVERDVDFFHSLLTELTGPTARAVPTESERYSLLRLLIDAVFTSANLGKVAPERTDYVASLLMTAARMMTNPTLAAHHHPSPDFITTKLAAFGPLAAHVAAAFIGAHWTAEPQELGPELMKWIFDTVTEPQWNDSKRELAARGMNLLWTAGDYDRICELIDLKVDCTVSANAWGGPKREGVYTGYIQPLTHVLGRYLKPISLLGTERQPELKDVPRVEGALQIVQVLGKLPSPPKIVLHYPKIQSCEMIELFDKEVGTIWGFEDVRLPYVLAARDTTDGQRPLRMLDMWDAIAPAFKAYPKLISNPTKTIAECVEAGVKTVIEGVRKGDRQYEGIKEDKYLPEFRRMCTEFLTYFATRRPYGTYIEPTNQTGMASNKLLPGYACKVGIHWSAERAIPLYYCLDGLNMEDVFNYKNYKIKEIDAYLSALGTPSARLLTHPFQEIITLAEVREIVRRWDKFKHVVRFVEQGRMIPPEQADAQVRKWQVTLGAADKDKHRTWPAGTFYYDEAYNLKDDFGFWAKVGVRERWKSFKESKTIELAAKNVEGPGLLLQVLDQDCPTLRELALVPDGFVEFFRDAVKADPTARPAVLAKLREALSTYVCPGLRATLGAAIDLHFGPPPLPPTPPAPLVEVELHVGPVPGAVPVTISSPEPDPGAVSDTATDPGPPSPVRASPPPPSVVSQPSPPPSQPQPPPSQPPPDTPVTPSGTPVSPSGTPSGDG